LQEVSALRTEILGRDNQLSAACTEMINVTAKFEQVIWTKESELAQVRTQLEKVLKDAAKDKGELSKFLAEKTKRVGELEAKVDELEEKALLKEREWL
jgi:chromosome segregation ATPase